MAHSNFRLTAAALLILFACTQAPPSSSRPILPPNVRVFQTNYEPLWATIIKTVSRDRQISFEVEDARAGLFATKLITEGKSGVPVRYRISGRVIREEGQSLVTLYNSLQAYDGQTWKTVPTDNTMEKAILDEVAQKLAAKSQ